MQISPNQKLFPEFFYAFPEFKSKPDHFEKKDEPQRLFVSEIIDCKNQCDLNAQKAPCQNTCGQSTC